eukprot:TRINITY_DN84523_c0_g1_i1.p1 TRINITY_DN84523_c0_g1~~TRINITY_DN84523_c0_g1_i1.p1  ORF type:complete len:276 (+),score=28.63 TRINITY_DN84523_c0_g1_i1:24-851(+)
MNALLFPKPKSEYPTDRDSGIRFWGKVPCIVLTKPKASCVVVFFHGNAENLGTLPRPQLFILGLELNAHVLAPELPGYAPDDKESPSVELFLMRATQFVDFVRDVLHIPESRILLIGRSIGASAAVHVASQYAVGGLATISAFATLQDVARNLLPVSRPVCFALPGALDNSVKMENVRCPVVLLHGKDDRLVPATQLEILHRSCSKDVLVVCAVVDGVGHNDVYEFALWSRLFEKTRTAFGAIVDAAEEHTLDADCFVCHSSSRLVMEPLKCWSN